MDVIWLGQKHELLDVIELDLVVIRLSSESERVLVHVDIEAATRCEMEYIQECCECVSCNFTNLGFLDQGFVEEIGGVLLFLSVFLLGFLVILSALCRARDIEAHLNQL